MPKFIVETLQTFHEAHVIEAETAEEAKKIAAESDYNASIWLGTTFLEVNECSDARIEQWKQREKYFFEGYARVDKDGFLEYRKPDGTFNGNMPTMKIFEKSAEKVLDKQE